MAAQPEKAFCMLEYQSTKSMTTAQRDFRRKFHKISPCAISVSFLELSHGFACVSTVVLLVVVFGITSLLPRATNFYEVLLPMVQVSFLYAL
jgi:hypothetical protein